MSFGLILKWFGYAKMPIEATRLMMWIRDEASRASPDMERIREAAITLEKLFRSGRK